MFDTESVYGGSCVFWLGRGVMCFWVVHVGGHSFFGIL